MSLADTLLYDEQINDIPNPDPLIDGVLDLNSTALIYGPSGGGKSFVVLDWALCIATGTPWHGHDVTQAKVLYVVGEGLHGTSSRYHSWLEHHEIGVTKGVAWGQHAVNIQSREGQRDLLEAVKRSEALFVILDTIARHIPGGDENSFETMSYVVEVLDKIKTETEGCALGAHHTGKAMENGARGHSSLRGALDTEILCVPGPLLTVTKQKNHPDGHILGSFELLGVNGSMVLSPKDRRTNRNDDTALRALAQYEDGARYEEWKAATISLGMAPGSFDRTRKRLLDAILVCDTTDTDSGEVWYRLPRP